MKYRKYLVFIVFLMMVNVNTITAKEINLNDSIAALHDSNQKLNVFKPYILEKRFDTSYNTTGVNTSDKQMSCEELFDPSIIELVNDVLKYPRYIVPLLIIVLGTIDFFKAVMASKEDEMKKAQKTFIKRLIIGVCVFMVPLLINAIMWLANIAWEGLGYTTCNF